MISFNKKGPKFKQIPTQFWTSLQPPLSTLSLHGPTAIKVREFMHDYVVRYMIVDMLGFIMLILSLLDR
jgi:hypothetical protein